MFFDDSLKDLKKELKNAGADLSYVRQWQKVFDKVKKQSEVLEGQYTQVKQSLDSVYATLKDLEKILIRATDKSVVTNLKAEVQTYAKTLKKYQNTFNHEFLISKKDTDFQSTYASVLSMSNKSLKEKQDILILQSEVENLLALTKEALDKEWPSFKAMAYFYLNHDDKEISDLPHADKVTRVTDLYMNEFYNPMYRELIQYLDEGRVSQILEVDVWK